VECFDYGVAAIELVFHGWSPRTVFVVSIISRFNAQDPWWAAMRLAAELLPVLTNAQTPDIDRVDERSSRTTSPFLKVGFEPPLFG
jgi:hypothetical protein